VICQSLGLFPFLFLPLKAVAVRAVFGWLESILCRCTGRKSIPLGSGVGWGVATACVCEDPASSGPGRGDRLRFWPATGVKGDVG